MLICNHEEVVFAFIASFAICVMSEIDIRFSLAFLAPTLGFVVWFAKRLIDDARAEDRRLKAEANLMRALFAEIDFTVGNLQHYLRVAPGSEELMERFTEKRFLIPHITDRAHTQIYDSRIADIHWIPDADMQLLVAFYGLVHGIEAQVEGLQKPSFSSISASGKCRVMELISEHTEEAVQFGQKLLASFRDRHPELITVFAKGPDGTLEETQARLQALRKKLDQWNTQIH
ncbi:MAG: hypothetical protein AAGK37_05470 [Pseudomonadota bacterium]